MYIIIIIIIIIITIMYYYHYLIIIVTNIMLNLWQPYSSLNAKEYVIEYILFDFKVRETQRFYEVKNPVPSVIYCTCLLIFFFFDFRTQIIVWKSIGSITVVVCFRPSLSATQINMVDHFLCRVSFFNCTSSGLCSCNISNTRDSVSSGCPNNERRVENMMKLEVFG